MGSGRAICTIIAKNYLAYARTLCESYQALHPEDRCFVLIVDEYGDYVDPSRERCEIVGVEELGISGFYPNFAFKYNVTELSTAVKPYFMEWLFRERGIEKLLYLDPDILVLRRLDPLYEALDRSAVVLTPHLDADYPDDGLLPDDAAIMKSGVYNLGFIGCSDQSIEILRWWQVKLYDKCLADSRTGYFVDQKFMDFVQCFFDDVHIERNAGYNVAYWNLHSRRITNEDGVWFANGCPIGFFHFSGITMRDPEKISKHTDRYDLTTRPELRPLFDEYRSRVKGNGHELTSSWRYTYGHFDTGESIPDSFRKQYRESKELQTRCDDPFVHESFRRNCREFRPLMVEVLMGRCYKAIANGDYRTAMIRLREACAYDRTLPFSSNARSYTKWAAKLWFHDQSRRLSNRRQSGRMTME